MTASGRAAEDLSAGGPTAKVRRLQLSLSLRAGRWTFHPQIEALLRLAELREEAGVPSVPLPEDGVERLDRLRGEAGLLEYVRWRDRCRDAALALGVPWPPASPIGRRDAFVFCCEEPLRVPVPVVYPADWDRSTEPDLFGLGDRWTAGRLLLVPVEDLPIVAEVVREPRRSAPVPVPLPERRELLAPRRELEPAEEDRRGGGMRARRVEPPAPGLEGLSEFDAWVRRS